VTLPLLQINPLFFVSFKNWACLVECFSARSLHIVLSDQFEASLAGALLENAIRHAKEISLRNEEGMLLKSI